MKQKKLLMTKYVLVTGGAGFVGTNLIIELLKNPKLKIISLDNYSTGKKSNHQISKNIKYLSGNTKNLSKILDKYKKKISCVFHFGEFSRIYQSFKQFEECFKSNLIGSQAVFKFCLNNKIKLIYSATSASLGNNGKDKNLSPYAFTKSKNLELLENLKKWFNFKFEVIYFYNVYGPYQICEGDMATVVGIFQNLYLKNKPLTVVKPGNQRRRFTHILDTVKVCLLAWKKNKCLHYGITNKNQYSIIELARMFNHKVKYLPKRPGERYASALINENLSNKVNLFYGKYKIKDYVKKFLLDHKRKD